jgi:hypothetical protein
MVEGEGRGKREKGRGEEGEGDREKGRRGRLGRGVRTHVCMEGPPLHQLCNTPQHRDTLRVQNPHQHCFQDRQNTE